MMNHYYLEQITRMNTMMLEKKARKAWMWSKIGKQGMSGKGSTAGSSSQAQAANPNGRPAGQTASSKA